MQHLTTADYTTVPWKNGLGTTQQLASDPTVSDYSKSVDFQWRISIADMVENTDFSIFPSVDRVLTVIDGMGVKLAIGGSAEPLSCMPFKPISFSGDEACFGKLLDGPVKNFNVMCNRKLAEAKVHILEAPCTLLLTGGVNFFYVPLGCGPTIFNDGQAMIKVAGGDSVMMCSTNGCDLAVFPESSMLTVKFLHVCITMKTSGVG